MLRFPARPFQTKPCRPSVLPGGSSRGTMSARDAGMAPSPGFATLPLTAFVIGMACGTLPIGAIARRHGRRTALLVGAFSGAICGVMASVATVLWSFPLLCAATFFGGAYAAASQSYRFAATDGASPRLQPKIISWVMAGGVLAGVIGPQLVQHTMNLWAQHLFAATYLGQAAVAILAAWLRLSDRLNGDVRATTRTGWGVDRERFPVGATDFGVGMNQTS